MAFERQSSNVSDYVSPLARRVSPRSPSAPKLSIDRNSNFAVFETFFVVVVGDKFEKETFVLAPAINAQGDDDGVPYKNLDRV